MPLSPPVADRIPGHVRQVTYRSFQRTDGLWDIEGELLDTKATDVQRPSGYVLKAGTPIHRMLIRVTIDTQLVVQAIEAAMDAHPLDNCPAALDGMQKMVGACMARGWRKAIETHLHDVAGCTHMRELLNNMATAAFQSIFEAFTPQPGQVPMFIGRCTGWDGHGPAVAQYYPQFVGYEVPSKPAR